MAKCVVCDTMGVCSPQAHTYGPDCLCKAPRFGVDFVDGEQQIEVVYWCNERGETTGEAYFRGWDMCSDIIKGEFAHPFHGNQYRLHIPSKFGKSKDAILEKLEWRNVGRSEPKPG